MSLWPSPATVLIWKLTEAPDNAGFTPDALKESKWYRETTRKGDVSHFSSSSRISDAFVETDWTSYQVREPIEDDEERLAMKIGVCLLHCQDELLIR